MVSTLLFFFSIRLMHIEEVGSSIESFSGRRSSPRLARDHYARLKEKSSSFWKKEFVKLLGFFLEV